VPCTLLAHTEAMQWITGEEKEKPAMRNSMRNVFQIESGALNLTKGVRTAAGIFLPLYLCYRLHNLSFGITVALGVLIVSYCDPGPSLPYARRAKIVSMSTVLGALVLALGRSVGSPWWLAVPAIFLATFLAGCFSVLGRIPAAVSLTLCILFVVGLGQAGGPGVALSSLAGFLLGGAILLFLVLLPWPLQQFRTARSSLREDRVPQAVEAPPALRERSSLATITSQMTWTSPLFRFNVFKALGAALAASLGWGLGLLYPHWAAVTVIIAVRPSREASITTLVQNVLATILGALVAAWLITNVQSLLVLLLIVVLNGIVGITFKEVNYAISVFFLTTILMLLLSLQTPGIPFIKLRVVETLVGAAIALGVIFGGSGMGMRSSGARS
jgi:uncharacterized membrane protein YccC